jgi:hypothetical protein
MAGDHYIVTPGFLAICHLCWAHLDKEERKFTRHFNKKHAEVHQDNQGTEGWPYEWCRLIPEKVLQNW